MYGDLVLWAGVVEDGEDTQIIGGICSLNEQLWINGQRVKGLYGATHEGMVSKVVVLLEKSNATVIVGVRIQAVLLFQSLEDVQDVVEKKIKRVV